MHTSLAIQEITAYRKYELHKVKLLLPALCRVKQGKKIIEWNGHTEIIDSSQLIIFPAGHELYMENIPIEGQYLSELIYLPSTIKKLYLKHNSSIEQHNKPGFAVNITRDINYCWQQFKFAIEHNYSRELIEHLLLGILLLLDDFRISNIFLSSATSIVTRCVDLLSSYPNIKWTSSKVAQQLNISLSTLHRQLAIQGINFQQIIDDVRLGNALNDIQTTQKSIGEIAINNGYKCHSRFTERFKKRYQITPLALRKASQHKNFAPEGINNLII